MESIKWIGRIKQASAECQRREQRILEDGDKKVMRASRNRGKKGKKRVRD